MTLKNSLVFLQFPIMIGKSLSRISFSYNKFLITIRDVKGFVGSVLKAFVAYASRLFSRQGFKKVP